MHVKLTTSLQLVLKHNSCHIDSCPANYKPEYSETPEHLETFGVQMTEFLGEH